MRRGVCSELGPPESLTLVEEPDPLPAAGQVVVAVDAAGVNWADALVVAGRYQIKVPPPFTPGGELAGRIAALGEGSDGWAVGDRVLAMATGAYASHVALPVGALVGVPDALDADRSGAGELTGGGVDLVVDPVGGEYAEPALRATGWEGRYLVLGFAGGDIPNLRANLLLLNNRTAIGVDWAAWTARDPVGQHALLGEVLAAVADGRLAPPAPHRAPLGEAPRVLRAMLDRRLVGKTVLNP